MKIKAAVLNGVNEQFKISDVELDEPKNNEVLVKLVASGVCHTDATVINGTVPLPFPAILGHEGSGIVAEVGPNVQNFKKGDHVVIGFAACGECKYCKAGMPGACVRFAELNMGSGAMKDHTHRLHTENGQDISNFFGQSSLATYAVTDTNNLAKVPDDVDLRYLGPLGCGFMTGSGSVLNALNPEAGSTLAIFGTGAVGLSGIMAGAIANCSHIIAIDINDERLELAESLGATDSINSKKEDVKEKIEELTQGSGIDYALDTTGVPAVIESALSSLAIKGQLATIAVSDKDITINPMNDLLMPSRTIKGVIEGDAVPQSYIPKLVSFYQSGKFPVNKLSKFYDLEQVDQAFEDSKAGKTVKPIIILDKDYSV